MQEAPATAQNYQRTAFRKAVFCISAVLFAGLLMLAMNYTVSAYAVKVVKTLFGASFPAFEWQALLADIVLYLLLLLVPGIFLLIVFRKNPFSPFAGPLSAPPYPFLFVPMCIGLLYALNLAVNLLSGDLFAPFEHATDPSSLPMTLPGILLYFVQLSLLPALFEEWLFRGIMLRQLIPSVGKWPAVFISAFVFGLMHLNPAQSIFAFGFGLFAGYAYVCTGSIWFGALIHMLNNAVSGCVTYWSVVFEREDVMIAIGILVILLMIFGVVSFAFYIPCSRKKFVRTRRTREERLLPGVGSVFRAALCSPMLYLMIGAYGFLLWLYYFAK